jgi:hypothetical protein
MTSGCAAFTSVENNSRPRLMSQGTSYNSDMTVSSRFAASVSCEGASGLQRTGRKEYEIRTFLKKFVKAKQSRYTS